jgi:hypothetical protein
LAGQISKDLSLQWFFSATGSPVATKSCLLIHEFPDLVGSRDHARLLGLQLQDGAYRPARTMYPRGFDVEGPPTASPIADLLADRTIAPASFSGNLVIFRIQLPKEEHSLEVANDPLDLRRF